MIQKLAAFVMMFAGSTICLAQEATAPAETKQSQAEVDAEIESDIANAEVTAGHFSAELGVGLRKGVGPELRLNWYHDDDQVYGLKIGQYSAKDVSNFDKLSLMTVGIQSRFSLEGSFFIESGLDITQVKSTIDEAPIVTNSGTGTYGFEGSVNQVYFQMSFGNQWQSGSWTYGVDWIDLYVPFTGSSFATSSTGTISDREARERQDRRDLKTEAWDVTYGASIHTGIVF